MSSNDCVFGHFWRGEGVLGQICEVNSLRFLDVDKEKIKFRVL